MKRSLKIVFITDMYSEKMGYSENFLPKAVAKLGHEVHVIASTAQIYFSSPSYKTTYEPFLGPNIVAPCVKETDGYTLHRLPLKPRFLLKKVIRMRGLKSLLMQLSPDIIQVFNIYSTGCYEAAGAARLTGAKFFTENHIHASVFDMGNLRTMLKYRILGFPRKFRRINRVTVKHYPIAEDVAHISRKYFRVPAEKIAIQSLGVDTDLFTPAGTAEDRQGRKQRRKTLGFDEEDVVCIYTGRFTEDKNPQCLARAVDYLQEKGYGHIRALFVGSGTPEDVKMIESAKGCVVHPFVRVNELPPLYQLADIGVWPRQESMSQLDAVACGLPVIINNRVKVTERVKGNGLLYEKDDFRDLAEKILSLRDPAVRKKMGAAGHEKVRDHYSWDAIARKRVKDFNDSLEREPDGVQ